MEKDSFERQLEKMVSQADQNAPNNAGDRERVWSNVKLKNRAQKWWWGASAAVVTACFVLAFYQMKEPTTTIAVLKDKPLSKPKTSLAISLPEKEQAISTKETQIKQERIKHPKPDIHMIDEPVSRLVETKPINTVATPQIATIQAIVETTVENRPQKVAEPEFTVQFKKGTATVKNVDGGQVYTSFKKFKLKRDTTYFATVEEKQPNPMKLSFKKEN